MRRRSGSEPGWTVAVTGAVFLAVLRPVLRYAHLGEALERLPEPLASLIGRRVAIERASLRGYHELADSLETLLQALDAQLRGPAQQRANATSRK